MQDRTLGQGGELAGPGDGDPAGVEHARTMVAGEEVRVGVDGHREPRGQLRVLAADGDPVGRDISRNDDVGRDRCRAGLAVVDDRDAATDRADIDAGLAAAASRSTPDLDAVVVPREGAGGCRVPALDIGMVLGIGRGTNGSAEEAVVDEEALGDRLDTVFLQALGPGFEDAVRLFLGEVFVEARIASTDDVETADGPIDRRAIGVDARLNS